MASAAEVLMNLVNQRNAREIAESDRRQKTFSDLASLGQNRRQLDIAQQNADTAEGELGVKRANAPLDATLKKSQAIKALADEWDITGDPATLAKMQALAGSSTQAAATGQPGQSLSPTISPTTLGPVVGGATTQQAQPTQTASGIPEPVFGPTGKELESSKTARALATKQVELDMQAKKEIEAADAKKKSDLNIKRADLKRDLTSVLAFESTIPRSEKGGVDRFIQGGKNLTSGFLQNSKVGENIATYRDLIDQITPKVARASGDVANIAVAERQFAKKAFAGMAATKGVSAKKRAFLVQFTKAIDSEDESEVRKILDAEGIPYLDLETMKYVNLTVDGEEVTEEEIVSAMEKYSLSRDEVLEKLNG